jgi:hypothetical protein
LKQKLPPQFQNIADIAAKEKGEIEQIDKVTSMMQDTLQYLGDWKTVKGRIFSRDLATIGETQLGDCKDFASSTAAILNKLGYQANVALVERGYIASNKKTNLPTLKAFNHAIVHITGKSGKEYWIDPTNVVSMAGNIFPDIADRWSLILDIKNPKYTKIPPINYSNSIFFIQRDLTIDKDVINKNVLIELSGESAMQFTGMSMYLSDKAISDILYRLVEGRNVDDGDKKRAIIPKLDSRIVKDLKFELEYTQKNGLLQTNLGKGIPLSYGMLKKFMNSSLANVQDNFIGNEETVIRKTVIKGRVINNIESINFNMTTPWIKLSRIGKSTKDGAEILDTFEISRSYMYSSIRQIAYSCESNKEE